MPELPEVETVRRGLAPTMEGAVIEKLQLNRPDLRFPFPPALAARAEGRTIRALGRRAKYLLIELDDGTTIVAHLGMSGSFRIEDAVQGDFHHARSKDEKHDHVIFHLRTSNGRARILYNDPRRFGFLDLIEPGARDTYPPFLGLGPEPTGNSLGADYLASRLAGKAQPLKSTLLDQKVIAGLGNIYVCEALWRAHLSPERKAGSLVNPDGGASDELVLLTEAIRTVIAEAIAAGGSSLKDYVQADGSLGYFQHTFRVYDQEGEPCRTAGCGSTVSRIVQAGRSTFFCPACQK